VLGAREDIDEGEALLKFSGAHPHHAAHHRDLEIGPLLLHLLEAAEEGDGAVLRALTHGAGVEHHHVRVFRLLHRLVAEPVQPGAELGGVRHVHLATNGPNVISRHGQVLSPKS
jgi:hypothetical protein